MQLPEYLTSGLDKDFIPKTDSVPQRRGPRVMSASPLPTSYRASFDKSDRSEESYAYSVGGILLGAGVHRPGACRHIGSRAIGGNTPFHSPTPGKRRPPCEPQPQQTSHLQQTAMTDMRPAPLTVSATMTPRTTPGTTPRYRSSPRPTSSSSTGFGTRERREAWGPVLAETHNGKGHHAASPRSVERVRRRSSAHPGVSTPADSPPASLRPSFDPRTPSREHYRTAVQGIKAGYTGHIPQALFQFGTSPTGGSARLPPALLSTPHAACDKM